MITWFYNNKERIENIKEISESLIAYDIGYQYVSSLDSLAL